MKDSKLPIYIDLIIEKLKNVIHNDKPIFRYNQEKSLEYLSLIIKEEIKGTIIADEVGMGKTRIAIYAMLANAFSGESSLVIVPPGLIHQWIKEWQDVIRQLRELNLFNNELSKLRDPIHLQRFDDIFTCLDKESRSSQIYPILTKDHPRIILIPHTLTMHIRNTSYIESIDLPQLIKAHDKELKTNHHLEKSYYNNYYSVDSKDTYFRNKGIASKFLFEMHLDSFSTDKKNDDYSEIDLINEKRFHYKDKSDSRSYKEYTEYFRKDRAGIRIYYKSFFKLIGDYSLIVIDEAHKSKSEDGDQKVLGTIIKYAKENVKSNCFTIGMTATPVELSPTEWRGIIKRVGEELNEMTIIDNFTTSLINIRNTPNNSLCQANIIKDSINFEKCLNKNVTRRMRRHQSDFVDLLIKGGYEVNECFPHHNRMPVSIKIDELIASDPEWVQVAFYYEAINKAALGLTLNKAKHLDKVFACGNLNLSSLSLLITNLETNANTSQEKRLLFWAKKLQMTINGLDGQKRMHPRLSKTLDLVESILLNSDGTFKEEKVLIFTTFNESAKELNDLINERFSLRLIDLGKLSPISDAYAEILKKAFKNTPNHIFKGNLKGVKDANDIIDLMVKKYENVREKITKQISDDLFKNPEFIGEHLFKNDEKALELIKKFFASQLIDLFIDDRNYKIENDDVDTKEISPAKIKDIIYKQWKEIVTDYLSNEDLPSDYDEQLTNEKASGESAKNPITQGNDEDEKRLDFLMDRISLEELKKVIQNVIGEDEDPKQPTSKISRRIYGSTPMNTRKNVQTLFNNKEKFPKVLVAQSRVGREGLNLHKACRNLILFHQEWNPGVIEQQIGRIDRIDSYWQKLLEDWIKNDKVGERPKINIYSIVFEGTYDEHQAKVLNERSKNLQAQLFGGILTEENLKLVKEDFKKKIKECAPNFSPEKYMLKKSS